MSNWVISAARVAFEPYGSALAPLGAYSRWPTVLNTGHCCVLIGIAWLLLVHFAEILTLANVAALCRRAARGVVNILNVLKRIVGGPTI